MDYARSLEGGAETEARYKENGLWSIEPCRLVIDWRDHILRPANADSWPAILYEYRGAQWLMECRAQHNSNLLAGRTGTRVAAGHVAMRWHDGVRYAEAVIAMQ